MGRADQPVAPMGLGFTELKQERKGCEKDMKDYIAVDVDGHIMEPPDLFENKLEPKYRDRAYKLVEDEAGVEHPVMDNIWLDDTRPVGTVSVYGAVDKPIEDYLGGKVHYRDSMVPGAWVPDERLKVMDEEGIDIALFYPSSRSGLGEFQ